MIHTTEQIKVFLQEMQSYLDEPFNRAQDANASDVVIERALYLENMMSFSGKLLADAGYRKDEFVSSEIVSTIKEALNIAKWPASVTMKKVDAVARDYNHLCTWADRVNRTATHCHQFCISLLSKMKSDSQLSHPRYL